LEKVKSLFLQQALASCDHMLAREVLAGLVRALIPESSAGGKMIATNVAGMLQQSTSASTPFVSCMLRLCLDSRVAKLRPSLVGDIAKQSVSFHMGIMLLEKQILMLTQNGTKHYFVRKLVLKYMGICFTVILYML